ncbi:MAG: NAD-dependent epimerase/dehydratase family protein [Candidatus Competibacterales bacterium]
MQAKTVLVTGAAGFIGSHSVDRLLALGHRVIGLDNFASGKRENLHRAQQSPRFTLVEGDVTDGAILTQLFERESLDGVLHLAALVSVPRSFADPEGNARLNLYATDQLARLCVRYSCLRLVFASSAAVYGDGQELPSRETALPQPTSPYGAAKLAGENMLLGYGESFGLQAVCLRYFNIYGPRQDPSSPYSGVLSIFAHRHRNREVIKVYGDGEQSRDFVSVKDVAGINVHGLVGDAVIPGRYNVCTGRAVSLNRILAVFREIYPEAPAPLYCEPRVGDIRHSLGDPSRLEAMLGINAQVSLEEGLRALVIADGLPGEAAVV